MPFSFSFVAVKADSIIVNSRSHNRQEQNIVAINGRSDDIGLPPSKLFIDNGSNHNKQSTVYNLKLHRQNEA
jgi:hypothetical protein